MNALNIVLGLVFIYLLYSLLASVIQELLASVFGMRAGMLKKGVRRMLDDSSGNKALSSSFYGHPLIKYFGKNWLRRNPSYLSSGNFSKVVVDLLRGTEVKPGEDFSSVIQRSLDEKRTQWGNVPIPAETHSLLNSFWVDSQKDVERFKVLLEKWFEDMMERVTGWYKRSTQLMLFFIGAGIAVFFNVDTITITKSLARDPELADQLAENAAVYLEAHARHKEASSMPTFVVSNDSGIVSIDTILPEIDSASYAILNRSTQLIDSANGFIRYEISNSDELLGIGWECPKSINALMICVRENFHWKSLIGWIITAFAISFGAPFWYDVLNKIIRFKGTGGVRQASAGSVTPSSLPVRRVG